ncbi:hypothetical protein IE077_003581 [Cardiosporidium cionae]|uniref:Uncharacterized protein n=1 Tax=Cardiosporidium cionae TaxID=476202 RepID=A0ABQ7J7X8_9APIC|nr:hypothetical protein IE077_003581 [Cardiosporidium cionae]|eukprot:KAF8820091.1 hypothetical protein IE077_003581 [Cardiosporidium cionae]
MHSLQFNAVSFLVMIVILFSSDTPAKALHMIPRTLRSTITQVVDFSCTESIHRMRDKSSNSLCWSYRIFTCYKGNFLRDSPSNSVTRLRAATRTGIAIPPDIAAYGRAVVHKAMDDSITMEIWLPGLKLTHICCSIRAIGSPLLPPMLVILAAKNHIVRLWERKYFNTKRRKDLLKDFTVIQRAYRLPRPCDFGGITAKYSGSLLQIYIPSSENKHASVNLPFSIPIQEDQDILTVQSRNFTGESSWIFNWEKFPELYNLAHDYTKVNISKFIN